MTCIIQRLADGAKHADVLTAASPDVFASLEVHENGIRCRYVQRWYHGVSDIPQREVVQYEVTYRVLENAHTNPLIEALNQCKSTMEIHIDGLKVS